MRIGVTGGSGGIGRYVCDELMQEGHAVVSLDLAEPDFAVEFCQVDLNSLQATCSAVEGFGQIIHLAARLSSGSGHKPEEVIGGNTVSAYNVFEAARMQGIPRVVYGCSETSAGYGIQIAKLTPRYLPIDEDHEMWPHVAYSISKYFGERIGANYAKAFGLEVISLRFTMVWLSRIQKHVNNIVEHARQGADMDFLEAKDRLGAHVAVRDVGRACAAAVRFKFDPSTEMPFEAFFVSARDTFFSIPTLEAMESWYDPCPPEKDPDYFGANPYASVYDIRKAQRMLGWQPQLEWRNFEEWEM